MTSQIISLETIKRLALDAAESGAGPQANPYPAGSAPFYVWLDHYYSSILSLSMEVA